MLGLQDLTDAQHPQKPVGMGVWSIQAAKESKHQDLCPGTMAYTFDVLLELRFHKEYEYIRKILILDASWSYFPSAHPFAEVEVDSYNEWKRRTASLRTKIVQLDDPKISEAEKTQIRGEILEHEKTPGRNCYFAPLLTGRPEFQDLHRAIARPDKYIKQMRGVNYPNMGSVGGESFPQYVF